MATNKLLFLGDKKDFIVERFQEGVSIMPIGISENVNVNPLYLCGFRRVGCIGCPMAGKQRIMEFVRYPKHKAMYIQAFDKMLITKAISRERRGQPPEQDPAWQSGESVFKWWIDPKYNPSQITLEDVSCESHRLRKDDLND